MVGLGWMSMRSGRALPLLLWVQLLLVLALSSVGAGSPVSVPSSCVLRVGGFNTDSSVLLPFSPAAGENFPTAFRATANSTVVRTCVDTTTARLTHRT